MHESSSFGWYSRAVSYPHSFTPASSAVRLVVLRNASADPDGFTLTLFDSSTKFAVDAAGKILKLTKGDFDGIIGLGNETKDLPSTGRLMNTWVVAQPTTSQPIDHILLPVDGNGFGSKETNVRGCNGDKTKLKTPVGDYEYIPTVLQDLVKSALEALDGERDNEMIDHFKGIRGNVL